MNFIRRLFFKKKNELPELPQWMKDAYIRREEKEANLKSKYLQVVGSFNFDKYSVFSELCKSFRCAFVDEAYMDFSNLSYCEYALRLSPKVNFPIQRLKGKTIEYRGSWEEGISGTVFYDPPLLIGDVALRPGHWKDNSRVIDCFQLIKVCDKCGNTISGGRCYGLATIGHFLIYDSNDYHYCAVAIQEYQETLMREAIDRLIA